VGKNFEGDGYGNIILTFSWRDWGKPWKTSLRISSSRM